MKLFISKTPLRISLFGGGTDLKSYYKKEDGAVMSFGINKFLYVILKKNEKLVDFKYRVNWSKTEFANKIDEIEHPIVREAFRMHKINFPIEVSTFSDIPANTGLGSSSAFAVGLVHCISKLLNLNYSKYKIAEIAAKIEINILKRNMGKQDHFASAFGGFNIIKFNKSERVTIRKQKISSKLMNELNSSFLIFFLNKKRDASKILSNQKKLNQKNYESLNKIKKNVFIAEKIIKNKDKNKIKQLGVLLSEAWYWKKLNNRSVSYKIVDDLYSKGIDMGCYGGKLLGAGGGGYFLFLANVKKKKIIKSYFKNFSTIDAKIHQKGTEIVYAHEE
jgi:D-glycero-alpha-D-manno-heptose-7-phosphate kinase